MIMTIGVDDDNDDGGDVDDDVANQDGYDRLCGDEDDHDGKYGNG